jgi:DNA-binding transcriptional ArsR family regulator
VGNSWFSDYIDDDLAKAISHPTRAQILSDANERIMSPTQFARRHEMDVSNVAYHFKQLADRYHCLELVAEVSRRGSTEHFYKATRRALFDGKAWEALPETVKNKISGRTVSDLLGAIAQAMLVETFDERDDRILAWDRVLVDERGWQEIANVLNQAMLKTMKVAEAATARLVASEDEAILASWAMMFFKSPFREPELDTNQDA